jgi:ketosteroid isomerase-like protein
LKRRTANQHEALRKVDRRFSLSQTKPCEGLNTDQVFFNPTFARINNPTGERLMSNQREMVERFFAAVMAKDMDGVLAFFADDAELIDPHYPKVHMKGKAAIKDELAWGFGSLEKFGFVIVNYMESPDGTKIAIEVDTHHVVRGSMKLDFPQAFFIDMKEGKVTRVQAYEPYGPHGIGGLILRLTRLKRKLTGKG